MPKQQTNDTCRCAVLFLLFCCIGWIYEVALAFLYGYGFINRGFLFGPYLPLYGFGALLLLACLTGLMKRRVRLGPVSITPLLVFLGIVLITTGVEYLVSWLLELIFHQRWWDYSTYRYQLHGRICLSASIRFGLGGMAFLYLLTPLFDRIIARIPTRHRKLVVLAVVLLLAADFALTLWWASAHGFNPELGQPR